MKTSGIYSAFTFSIFLHAIIIAATFVIARNSNLLYRNPVPYIVTIVDSSDTSTVNSQQSSVISQTPELEAHHSKPKTQRIDISSKVVKDLPRKQEDSIIRERIEALEAKKKIEKMAALRKMVDIGGQKSLSQGRTGGISQGGSGPVTGGTTLGYRDYYSMVVNKIKQQWIFPESIDKDLLAIITIRIAKDGSITINRMEKSSGNTLFDRSALRAISKASPLPPPPQEMEIGVRFRP